MVRFHQEALSIGIHSAVLENSSVVGTSAHPVVIGQRTLFGHRCHVIGARIGNLCEIGNGSILMPARSSVTAASASTCRSELLDLPVRDHDYDGIGWTQLDPKEVPMQVQRARQLEPLVTGADCTGEYGCPGVYKTDQGDLAVQGRLLQPGELPSGAVIPAGEALVEIPRELLIAAARRLAEGGQAS